MRIAQVAPLFESVPPKFYGGTERVVFNLTEGLVRAGHDVTLFASGDSLTSARLVPTGLQALRLRGVRESLAPHLLMFERVKALADEFDVIHFHNEYSHFAVARELRVPTLSTMHGRLDLPEYRDLFFEFRELPLVSISENQKKPLSFQNWVGTVHHGLPQSMLRFNAKPSRYLAFLGRVSPEKGLECAIEIALMSGFPLKIAAKIETADIDYYHRIRHLFDSPGIEFVGEVGDRDKQELLGGAIATLFPIRWPEPFGLVMIESLACGTPVIAFRDGAVPEVIRHGVTGFVVDGVAEGLDALKDLHRIDRALCRQDFESRFSIERMVADYERLYETVIAQSREGRARSNDCREAPARPSMFESRRLV